MVDPNRNIADPAAWCTDIGGLVNASSPAIGNPVGGVETIYIGDRKNIFWAIDSKTHRPLWHWKIPLDGDVHGSPIINPVTGTHRVRIVRLHDDGRALRVGQEPEQYRCQWSGGAQMDRLHSALDPQLAAGRHLPQWGLSHLHRHLGRRLAAIDDNGATGGIPLPGKPGQPNWSLKLKFGKEQATKNYHSSPTIGPDGTIYVGTNKGIYAVTDNGGSGEVLSLFTGGITGEWDTAFSIDTANGKTFL